MSTQSELISSFRINSEDKDTLHLRGENAYYDIDRIGDQVLIQQSTGQNTRLHIDSFSLQIFEGVVEQNNDDVDTLKIIFTSERFKEFRD